MTWKYDKGKDSKRKCFFDKDYIYSSSSLLSLCIPKIVPTTSENLGDWKKVYNKHEH